MASTSGSRAAPPPPPPEPLPPSVVGSRTRRGGNKPPVPDRRRVSNNLTTQSANVWSTADSSEQRSPVVIGKDLSRAIRELQSVPSLKNPLADVEFGDYVVRSSAGDEEDSVFENARHHADQTNRQYEWTSAGMRKTAGSFEIDDIEVGESGSSASHIFSASSPNSTAAEPRANGVISGRTSLNDGEERLGGSQRSESATSDYESLRMHGLRCSRVSSAYAEIGQTTQSEKLSVESDVWSDIPAGASAADGNDAVGNATSGNGAAMVAVRQPTSIEFFNDDDDDIYERQMDDLELQCDGDVVGDEPDFRFVYMDDGLPRQSLRVTKASRPTFSGEYDVGLATCVAFSAVCGETDDRMTTSENSSFDVTASSPSSFNNICTLERADSWEDQERLIDEQEEFVRSVLAFGAAGQVPAAAGGAAVDSDLRRAMLAQELEDIDEMSFHDEVRERPGEVYEFSAVESPAISSCDRAKERNNNNVFAISPDDQEAKSDAETSLRKEQHATVMTSRQVVKETVTTAMKSPNLSTTVTTHRGLPTLNGTDADNTQTTTAAASNSGSSRTVKYQLNCRPTRVDAIRLTSFQIPSNTSATSACVASMVPQVSVDENVGTNSWLASMAVGADRLAPDDAVDCSAEELFEEIMESLNDALVPDSGDDLDDDLWVGQQAAHRALSASAPVIASKQPTAASSKIRPESLPEAQRQNELNEEEAVDRKGLPANYCECSSVFTGLSEPLGQQVPVVRVSVADASQDDPISAKFELDVSSDALLLELAASNASIPVVGCSSDVEDDSDVTTEEVSARSTNETFFEHQSAVQISSISSRQILWGAGDDDSDVDLDMVVNANAAATGGNSYADCGSTGSLDVVVDRNRRHSFELSTSHFSAKGAGVATLPNGEEPAASVERHMGDTEPHRAGAVVTSTVVSLTSCEHHRTKFSKTSPASDTESQKIDTSKESTHLEDRGSRPVETTCGLNEASSALSASENRVQTQHGVVTRVLSDRLTTQEVVLTVKLPRRLRAKLRRHSSSSSAAADDVRNDENGVLACRDETVMAKPPFRHLHVRRVVRVVDDDGKETVVSSDGEALTYCRPVVLPDSALSPTDESSRQSGAPKFVGSRPAPGETLVVPQSTPSVAVVLGGNDVPVIAVADEDQFRDSRAMSPDAGIEVDRRFRSADEEYVVTSLLPEVNRVRVVREDTLRVIRLPGCPVGSVKFPATMAPPISETVDGVRWALQRAAEADNCGLPAEVKITCEAYERSKTVTASPRLQLTQSETDINGDDAVTVVRRTLFPFDADAGSGNDVAEIRSTAISSV